MPGIDPPAVRDVIEYRAAVLEIGRIKEAVKRFQERREEALEEVARLKAEKAECCEAIEFTIRTLELCRDSEANPLIKICDRERAEKMLREALAKHKGAAP